MEVTISNQHRMQLSRPALYDHIFRHRWLVSADAITTTAAIVPFGRDASDSNCEFPSANRVAAAYSLRSEGFIRWQWFEIATMIDKQPYSVV